MKRMHMLLAAAALAGNLATLPASAIPPKSYVAPGAEAYVFDLEFGEYGSLNDQFNSPEGIDVDAQGNIWVAEFENNRISKFDPNGEYLFSFGWSGNQDGLFSGPRDIFIDKKRDVIWVADYYNNRVQKFDMEGNFLCKNSTVTAPRGVAVAAGTGWAYVTSATAHSVTRMTSACNNNGGWGGNGSGDSQFSTPVGVAIDANANVYVADSGNHRIQKFNEDGDFVTKYGVYGAGAADGRYIGSPQLYTPAGLEIDASGDLLVTDYNNDRVQKLRANNGTVVQLWGWAGSGRGQLQSPLGIASDAQGRIFVADRDNHRVVRFSPSKTDQSHLAIDALGTYGSGGGQLASPGSVSIDAATGKYWVTDNSNHRISIFNANGGFSTTFGSYGTGIGSFYGPSGIAVNGSNGYVFIVEYYNNRVQRFSTSNTSIPSKVVGAVGTASGLFTNPTAVAIDPVSNDFYVADTGNHRIQRFTQNGVFVMGIGNGTKWTGAAPVPAVGYGNGGFYSPSGVAVDKDGYLYVADMNNHRIQKFDPNGRFVTRWGTQGAGKGNLYAPKGIAVDNGGNVYVSDTSNYRIQRFTSTGRLLGAWGSYGTSAPVPVGLFNQPEGLAVTANGSQVVVADRANNRLQRFERFGFKVAPTPASRTVVQGANAKYVLEAKLDGANTLATKVAFKVLSGVPNNATATFSLASVKPTNAGQSTELTIATAGNTPAKTYKIPVEIEGGGQTRVVTLTLTVEAAP